MWEYANDYRKGGGRKAFALDADARTRRPRYWLKL